MRTYPAGEPGGVWLVLAHGAGAGHDHPWMRRAGAQLSSLGISVVTFDFPYKAQGRKLPDRAPVLEQAFAEVWAEVARLAGADAARGAGQAPPIFAGGKSMGGRIASQVAARAGLVPDPAGLVFLGYPLHPPGRPLDRRDRHLPGLDLPLLFLHGTRDAFGSPDEMRALAATLPRATLELVEGGDHSLVTTRGPAGSTALDDAFAIAADWMRRHAAAAR